ncbi:MAG TPA: hypothetical protein PLM07_09775 [Candidatus Rifleibacterium sp.]|nr:hypothetical protein [Candidatus Rifleibacterium sp.]HPT46175.1 hypothetical protein [Candidatus Rifleibacterium sp.]
MSETNELFPFPVAAEDENKATRSVELPAFPGAGESPLADDELRDLRSMLKAYRAGRGIAADAGPQGDTLAEDLPVIPDVAASGSPDAVAAIPAQAAVPGGMRPDSLWAQFRLSDPVEVEALAVFKEIYGEIAGSDDQMRVIWAMAGVFPIKKYLRIGTPEQKLFALNVLGDRFLQGLAGFAHPVRKKLLKAVSRFLSGVSEVYSFLSMEGEPFNPQYHERIAGSATSGRLIREMHGFLVVLREGNRVVRLGQVLT